MAMPPASSSVGQLLIATIPHPVLHILLPCPCIEPLRQIWRQQAHCSLLQPCRLARQQASKGRRQAVAPQQPAESDATGRQLATRAKGGGGRQQGALVTWQASSRTMAVAR